MMRELQRDFSKHHREESYDRVKRRQKGMKILSVLEDHFNHKLERLQLLDIGCSTGIIASVLSERFEKIVGIDIDDEAVAHANAEYGNDRVSFHVQNSMDIHMEDGSFDVIVCAHVYEHVPDSNKLLSEIYRLLKPEGVCCFIAGNRLVFTEPHYKLPLLSIIPRYFAHLYLKFLNRGTHYYEKHLTLWGLKKLTSNFVILDYTKKIIRYPEKYKASDVIVQGSIKQRCAMSLINVLYFLSPDFVWILKKK